MRKPISKLNMLSTEEYRQIVSSFNNTAVDYPKDKCVHTLFEEQVRKTPDKIVLVFDNMEFSYSKLNSMANAVANELKNQGIGKNDIVAIISSRSFYTVIAMLGIFKAGGAYLPIDYNYPINRINYIIKDSNAKSVLTYNIDFKVKNQIKIDSIEYTANYNNLINVNSDNDLCAVIYTSGSTGEPKGTLLQHKGVVNYSFANDALYDGGECVISYATYTFDAFFLDTVLPMIRGKKCVLSTEEEQYTQSAFEKLIEKNINCNLFITPAKLKQFILGSESKAFLKNINKICIGGEIFPTELLLYFDKKTQIFNVYGPTECSLWATGGEIDHCFQHERIKTIEEISAVSLLEYNHILYSFNDTVVEYPKDKCVHTLFEEQVKKTPNKTAVIACDRTLTYRELNEQANRIARSLIEKGIHNGDIVAFMLPRRSYLLSAMFGILKSGAAYMPIDPDYPQDRIDYMLADSGAKLCITEDNIAELLENSNITNPNLKMSSESLCYCIYTSGSTGKPKGTLLNHNNVVNYCNNNNNNNVVHSIIKKSYKTIVSVTTVGFDIFVTESILPLLNNLTIILANDEQAKLQKELNKLLVKYPADVLQTTPTKIKSLITDNAQLDYLKNFKAIILGGEALDSSVVKQISTITNAEIFNIYGPSEATVWVTNFFVTQKNQLYRTTIDLRNENHEKV